MLVEYVWLDINNNPRSKTRVITEKLSKDNLEIPIWTFDGSSTGQAEGKYSEVLIKPCAAFPDPFRGGDCILALCETYNTDMTPHASNTRNNASKLFEKYASEEPLFGIEQEFFLEKNGTILAFTNETNKPKNQGDYYCGNGENAIGRTFIDAAFKRCIMAGLKVTGYNAEVAPSQWEIQICADGINAADQIIMMRYILNRTAELHNISINLHPKPLEGDNWNGSGCHVNFSTNKMREQHGYTEIMECIQKLEKNHSKHMKDYGEDNDKRMTGSCETSGYDIFTYGVGDRSASVRIPISTHKTKSGYLEDRRPASNMDPYLVTSLILETYKT